MNARRQSVVLLLFLFVLFLADFASPAEVAPVLEFPEEGMDDPARYKNYTTRFFRDSTKNVLQIYVNQRSGRVVNLWADAANESLSFSVRDSSGQPAELRWCGSTAEVTTANQRRFLEYALCTSSTAIQIGHFLLGSMRKERDFQYFEKHLLPFNSEPFHEPELLKLITNLEKFPPEEKSHHLELLGCKSPEELKNRMDPKIHLRQQAANSTISVEQISFDGKNHLWLEITSPAEMKIDESKISIRSGNRNSIQLTLKVGTDAGALSPLDRTQIFNEAFLKYYSDTEKQANTNFRWLEREVRGMELVCYQEKLMAGLPNFATYFGRDTMMSALMLEPIWSVSMLEHAISSVLRKLSPTGLISHEEALGSQAIRENAEEYNKLMDEYWKKAEVAPPSRRQASTGEMPALQHVLTQARGILENLQRVRENYKMVDDDFQLPVLLGRYITNPQISADRKRSFLTNALSGQSTPRLTLILPNFVYVAHVTSRYVEQPDATSLVSFPKLDDGSWMSASWRDSGAGYGGGRFAMDVNVIWVPHALQAMAATLEFLRNMGYPVEKLESALPEIRDTKLFQYAKNPETLRQAIQVWRGSRHHFLVRLSRDEALQRIQSKLNWLPASEKAHWEGISPSANSLPENLEFLALSLDEEGKPIPVLNTDPAALFLLEDQVRQEDANGLLLPFLLRYPAGLFAENLGPLCANDAYASRDIWDRFQKDQYHSPRVVWGRDVNLLTLGLIKQILQSYDYEDAQYSLDALSQIRNAVEKSGLKHNELWSYEIENGKLAPVRYGTSSDIQLWNLTDLSVQFLQQRVSELTMGRKWERN